MLCAELPSRHRLFVQERDDELDRPEVEIRMFEQGRDGRLRTGRDDLFRLPGDGQAVREERVEEVLGGG